MKATDANYNEILNDLQKAWKGSNKMVDYCLKEISNSAILTDGHIITFEKEKIETRFCFGYDIFGTDYEEKNRLAYGAARTKEFFMKENLKGYERRLESLRDKNRTLYISRLWYGMENSKIKTYFDIDYENPYCGWRNDYIKSEHQEEDKKALIQVLEIEKAKFEKRLETWWKRYGAEHLHTWTYCQD